MYLERVKVRQRELVHQFAQMANDRKIHYRKAQSLRLQLLNATQLQIIGEFKRRSPASHYLAPHASLELVLSRYLSSGIDAISILTEPLDFGGSYDDLRRGRRLVEGHFRHGMDLSLPVLCKDFIVCKDQITLAMTHGASVVLLIAAMLDHNELVDLSQFAHKLGLEVLMELFDAEDLEKVEGTIIDVLAINNRSLQSLEVNPNHAAALLPLVQQHPLLMSIPVIAASGATDPNAAAALATQGFHGLLVGTELMGHTDAEVTRAWIQNARGLLNRECICEGGNEGRGDGSSDGRVLAKLCGFTDLEHARFAEAQGADYIGLVFAKSRRQVSLDQALTIAAGLTRAKVVAVFKAQPRAFIEAVAWSLRPAAVQCYETFTPALDLPSGTRLIRAFAGASGLLSPSTSQPSTAPTSTSQSSTAPTLTASQSLTLAADTLLRLQRAGIDTVLVDSAAPGCGVRDTRQDAALKAAFATLRSHGITTILAGGLNAENVADAIVATQPDGVDCSSGIEKSQKKEKGAITRFLTALQTTSFEGPPVGAPVGAPGGAPVKALGEAPGEAKGGAPFPPPLTPPSASPLTSPLGKYGGAYVPESLTGPLQAIAQAFQEAVADPNFLARLDDDRRYFIGRSTPLYHAQRLSEHCGHPIYLKREDLCHTGAHKINNAMGQGRLAQRMGHTHLIAETGAGQHGIATATVAARLGMRCTIFMGLKDTQRQAHNVARIRFMGATVVAVDQGEGQLKDATNEAIRYWLHHPQDCFYVIGSAIGPAPYPQMVRYFQSVIGQEAITQSLEQIGRLPDRAIACVGGGSNAIGLFSAFLPEPSVALIGVEAKGAATLKNGRFGVLHGASMPILQNPQGQISPTQSISAGLDYPGVGPEHAFLRDLQRTTYHSVDDAEALAALSLCVRLEGILPALESAHALAFALKPTTGNPITLVNLSGRGEKDLPTLLAHHESETSEGATQCP